MARRRSGREGRPSLPARTMSSLMGLAIGLAVLGLILTILDR